MESSLVLKPYGLSWYCAYFTMNVMCFIPNFTLLNIEHIQMNRSDFIDLQYAFDSADENLTKFQDHTIYHDADGL